jgi:photosystem II stability/assembly factor-like uncharacterized protein
MRKLKHILFTIASFVVFFFAFVLPEIGSWYQQSFPSIGDKTINDITFIDSLNGFAIASRNVNPDSSVILKTTNGGDSWSVVYSETPARFSRVQFINNSTGYISGKGGGTGFPALYKTTNQGNNWFTINGNLGNIYWDDMSVLNEDTIWLVDKNLFNGGVYRTTNGGLNWTQQVNYMSQNPNKIYMFNARIGFISNSLDNNLKKTTNSGLNWIDMPGGAFNDIRFIDSLTGWKAYRFDTLIKKTTDGGNTWIIQSFQSTGVYSGIIHQIFPMNKDTVWATGASALINSTYRGIIYKTTNGGNNWGYQIPDTSINIFNYSFIKFTDRLKGWAYSSFSAMGGVHTKTGGLDTTIFTKINLPGTGIVSDFRLYQNYPNPFNPKTVISYQLSVAGFITIKVYDLQGREIEKLINKRQSAGTYYVEFNANYLSSGIYFYSLQTENFKETKKMIYLA